MRVENGVHELKVCHHASRSLTETISAILFYAISPFLIGWQLSISLEVLDYSCWLGKMTCLKNLEAIYIIIIKQLFTNMKYNNSYL